MQVSLINPAFRQPKAKASQSLPKFRGHLDVGYSVPKENPAPAHGVDELNIPLQLSPEEQQQLNESVEIQQKAAEGFVTGITNGLDVITQNGKWREQFAFSKAVQQENSENIFDQISSLYHLTLARYHEATAHAPENKPASDKSSGDQAQTKAVPEQPKQFAKPTAFQHYQKVLQRYPLLAVESEASPVNLGEQAIHASAKPDQKLKKLQAIKQQYDRKTKALRDKQLQQPDSERFIKELADVLKPLNPQIQQVFEKID